MKIFCFTNLDEYKQEVWPKDFLRVPLIGEKIASASGKELKVVAITHYTYFYVGFDTKRYDAPAIKLELNR